MFIILRLFFSQDAGYFGNWGKSLGYSPVFLLRNIQSRDAFRAIECERKYLMNYNDVCLSHSAAFSFHRLIREKIASR